MIAVLPAETLEEMVRPFGVRAYGVSCVDVRGDVTRVTYDELAKLARSAAASLHRLGVREGDRVAVALDSTVASLAVQMGVWTAGATLLSIPPPPRRDSHHYRQGFGDTLRESGCKLLVGRSRVTEALEGVAQSATAQQLVSKGDLRAPDAPMAACPLVQFSSGSTGNPKGIVLSKDALASHLRTINQLMDLYAARDSVVSWLPLYHDMGFVGVWLSVLFGRGDATLIAPARFLTAPGEWLSRCASERATVTASPDFGYRLAARMLNAHGLDGDLSGLRICLFGAERVSWATLETFSAAGAPFGLQWNSLTPVYGMAEATLAVSCPPIGRGPRRDASSAVALGPPLPGLEVREVPIDGGDNLLELRGSYLLDGYLVGEEIVPAVDDDGWFATNDVGHVSEGELYVKGRADETVIVRGRNVFAEDVEAIAMRACDHEAVAVAAFRPEGEAERFALAVEVEPHVEVRSIARALQSSITRALDATVSPVVVLQPLSIPRTTSGKVRRPACRDLLSTSGWSATQVLALLD